MTNKQGRHAVRPRGVLIPIGGHEDKTSDTPILTKFVELAGGEKARIVVIPTASTEPQTAKRYEPVFRKLGVAAVTILDIPDREYANSDEALEVIRQATGIFISGGDQTRLVEYLGGTLVAECVRERYADGLVVAGTSAGASILASHMIEGGGNSDTPRKGLVNMIAGFSLAPDLIIDQHFSERGRIGRLLTLFASSPGLVSLGIDENTAAVIDRENILEVFGENSVIVVDVLMDYGHNLAALQGMVDFVQRLDAPRSVAMIIVPGDRRDDDVRAFGELAARSFDELVIDELVIYDNISLRGRVPGEIPEMLRRIAIDAGMPAERITIVFKEIDAAWAAVERAAPGELAMFFVDKPAKVWESLTRSSRTQALTKHDGHLPARDSHETEGHDGILVPLYMPASAPQPITVESIHDE
jgi:cyanophycinase